MRSAMLSYVVLRSVLYIHSFDTHTQSNSRYHSMAIIRHASMHDNTRANASPLICVHRIVIRVFYYIHIHIHPQINTHTHKYIYIYIYIC